MRTEWSKGRRSGFSFHFMYRKGGTGLSQVSLSRRGKFISGLSLLSRASPFTTKLLYYLTGYLSGTGGTGAPRNLDSRHRGHPGHELNLLLHEMRFRTYGKIATAAAPMINLSSPSLAAAIVSVNSQAGHVARWPTIRKK